MQFSGRVVSFGLISIFAACSTPSSVIPPDSTARGSLENDYLIRPSNGLGTRREALTTGDGPKGEQVFFINYDGVTITKTNANTDPDPDDATMNRSWIPNVGPGGTVAIPAFDTAPYIGPKYPTAQSVKDAITSLVQGWYSAYNVYIVTTRPSSGRYTMVVVGGQTAAVVTGAADAVGVAGLDCGNSEQNNIGFAFSASEPPQMPDDAHRQIAVTLVAQTIAHEAGHTFGLEHVNSPMPVTLDIMEAAVDPNVKGFLMGAQALHDGTHAVCVPTDTTEDTNARLLANPGPAPAGPVVAKPTVAWLAPKEGAVMPRNFMAAISASEPASAGGTVTKVEIVQSGVTIATMNAAPYQVMFAAPMQIADNAPIRFTAVATNSLGGKASVDVDFTVSASAMQGPIGCLVDPDCSPGQVCMNGSCSISLCIPLCTAGTVCQPDGTCAAMGSGDMGTIMMMTPVTIGQPCTDATTCGTGGVCATSASGNYCTQACDPADSSTCPSGYQCDAVGTDHLCGPKSHGCDVSRSAPPAGMAAFVVLALVGLARRRLRPSAA
jgi:hypothetical protein